MFSRIKEKLRSSLILKINLVIVLLLILGLGVLSLFINWTVADEILTLVRERNIENSRSLGNDLEHYFGGLVEEMVEMTTDEFTDLSQANIAESNMRSLTWEEDEFVEAYMIDKTSGETITAGGVDPEREISLDNLDLPEEIELGDVYWSSLQDSYFEDVVVLNAVTPVVDTDYYMVMEVSLEQVENIIGEWEMEGEGYPFLVDREGNLLAHPRLRAQERINFAEEYFPEIELAQEGNVEFTDDEGQAQVASYTRLESLDGYIYSSLPEASVYQANERVQRVMYIFAIITAVVLILLIGLFLYKHLVKPINVLTGKMDELAGGNLNSQVESNREDVLGKLQQSFNQTVADLRNVLQEINEITGTVSESSEELDRAGNEIEQVSENVSKAIEEVAGGSEDQVASIQNIRGKVEELTDEISSVEEVNNNVEELSGDLLEQSESSQEKIRNVTTQMREIDKTNQDVKDSITSLNQISEEIDSIVDIINDISDQTNLLALNAAIEAARAGQSGNSFSVVADEIRQLAEESADSAEDISSLIEEIKEKTADSSEEIEVNSEKIQQGVELVEETAATFNEIKQISDQLQDGVVDAAQAMEIVEDNSQEIEENINEIARIAERNSADVEEVAASSEEQSSSVEEIAGQIEGLNDITDSLREMLDDFKFKSDSKE